MENKAVWNNPTYLKTTQYKTDKNLAARQLLHQKFSISSQKWSDWLFNLVNLKPKQKILDVGCGNGILWASYLSTTQPIDFNLTLLDLSRGMVQTAQQNIANKLTNLQGVEASAMVLPFLRGYFDCLFANHMLYHVPNPAQAVKEFARVLNPTGCLIVTLNGSNHLEELWQLVFKTFSLDPSARPRLLLPHQAEPYLQANFKQVTLYTFDDALHVTDAELLWAYVLSSKQDAFFALASNEQHHIETKFKTIVNNTIKKQGHFYIQKDSVAFVCYK